VNIELNTSQKMIFSPQMQQSIEVLQMGAQELLNYIRSLAEENPIIEIEERSDEFDRYEDLKRKLEWLETPHDEYKVYYQEGDVESEEAARDRLSYVETEEEDLYEHLQLQLSLVKSSDEIRKAAQYIIECIDGNGYIDEGLKEIAARAGIGLEKTKEALHLVQSLEPPGIGARNLKECLLLQLERNKQENSTVTLIIENHLEMLSNNRLDIISKELDVSIDEVKQAYMIIQKLNPRPGSGFGTKREIRYQTPDLIVVKFRDYYEVLLNEYFYPKISISSYYLNILRQDSEREVKEYISGKIKEADWAIKCITQRNTTLIKVVSRIVEHQRKFFESGKGHLIPMNQKDIADVMGVHESTVSRAIRGKHLQCTWGVYSLDYFFINGLSLGGEERIASDSIKSRIKEIISGESLKKPYSDQQISDLLNREGISIARRTVAKYREELNIPGASKRKEF
jgi:RNA polymerase sigma-54 factor